MISFCSDVAECCYDNEATIVAVPLQGYLGDKCLVTLVCPTGVATVVFVFVPVVIIFKNKGEILQNWDQSIANTNKGL